MFANEGENLYGIAVGVLVWVIKAVLIFGALVLVVSIVLIGGLSLLRRERAEDPEEL